MHIKTFARAGTKAQAYPPGSGEQSDRLTARIVDTFVDAHLDLVEREGERLADGKAIVDSILANDVIVGVHRLSTDRYDVEIEYPAKTINGNERDIVYQTDTGPILWPDLARDPDDLLPGLELAFTAANAPGLGPDHRAPPDGDRRRRRGLPLRRLDPGRGHRQRVLPAPRHRTRDPPAGRPPGERLDHRKRGPS